MSILFDRTAANQRYTIPAYTYPATDWFFCIVLAIPTGTPNGTYVLSNGAAASSNTINLWVSDTNELGFYLNIGSTAGTIGEAYANFEYDTPTLLVVNRRSGSLEYHCAPLGYPLPPTGGADPLAGSAVLGAITLGAEHDETDWFGGVLSYLAMGAPALTPGQMNSLTNGGDLRDMGGVTVDRLYWPTDVTGAAPSTVQNLADPGTGDMALAAGAPVNTENPSFGDWTITGSGVLQQVAFPFDYPSLSLVGWRINIASPEAVTSSYGVKSGAFGTLPSIFGLIVDYDAPVGAAIKLDADYVGGALTGCYLKGRGYSSDTVGFHSTDFQGEPQTFSGSVVERFRTGALLERQLNGNVSGNLFLNQTGAAVQCLAANTCTVSGNTVILDGAETQAHHACLSAVASGTHSPGACTFSNNLVIVRDVVSLRALAQISYRHDISELPGVTFSNNIYVLPDTVDLDTTDLFILTGTPTDAANATFAEWTNAAGNPGTATVTGDRVIQLPVSEIEKLIEMKRNQYVVNSISWAPRRLDISPLRAPNLTVAANRDFNFTVRDTRDNRIISRGTETTNEIGALAITTGIVEVGIPCRVELVDPINTQSLIQPNIESI